MTLRVVLWLVGLLTSLFLFLGDADAQRRRGRGKARAKVSARAKKSSSRAPARRGRGRRAAAPARRGVQGDIRNVNAPTIHGKQGTKSPAKQPKQDPEKPQTAGQRGGVIFDPYRTLTIVSEDTTTINEGETNIVEVAEELKVDTTWVRIAEYYSVWDSRRVNPYGIDRSSFQDSVPIMLTDSANGRFLHMPIRRTQVNSRFGPRGGRFHYGVDLELDTGDSVMSCFDGIVRITGYDHGGWGNYVVVRHYNGIETLYGHLSAILTSTGTLVKAGDLLGWGGSTGRSSGPHLHLEIRYQGNAIDPSSIFDWPTWNIASNDFILTPDAFEYTRRVARRVLYHRVRRGDTMLEVARRYGLTLNELARLNGMSTRAQLRAGRRLRVK